MILLPQHFLWLPLHHWISEINSITFSLSLAASLEKNVIVVRLSSVFFLSFLLIKVGTVRVTNGGIASVQGENFILGLIKEDLVLILKSAMYKLLLKGRRKKQNW